MTRIKRYLLFTLAIIVLVFPASSVYADDATFELSNVPSGQEEALSKPDKTEAMDAPGAEKTRELPIQPLVQSTMTVEPQPVTLPASPVIVTGYQVGDGALQFFQLYNTSSDIMSLDGWKLEYRALFGNNEVLGTIDLSAYLLPRQYAIFGQEGFLTNADSVYTVVMESGFKIDRLQLISPHTYANNQVSGAVFSVGVRYDLTKSSAGNYTSTSKFIAASADIPYYGKGLYSYPDDAPLRAVEVLANTGNCGPLDDRIECHDYIKLYNTSDDPVDMSMYRLRLGYGNQSPGITNTVRLSGIVGAKQYKIVDRRDDGEVLDITATGGNVWIEDIYGLKAYAPTVISYQDIGETAHKGHSWALDEADKIWKWALPSPSGENNFNLSPGMGSIKSVEGLTPCRPDQERNPETNRCRSLASSSLAPCAPNQYRSEETNRCRNLASAASSLVSCAPNQIRNPETNRCKSLASEASTLVPCTANQERNPETNRCRNKAAAGVPDAAFAVEPIKDSGKAFVGWWALGGVGLLAVGYGVWEWRREIRSLIQRALVVFTTRK